MVHDCFALSVVLVPLAVVSYCCVIAAEDGSKWYPASVTPVAVSRSAFVLISPDVPLIVTVIDVEPLIVVPSVLVIVTSAC
ncbi:hypothetical protein AB3K25_02720 [Leuconostoc sp. MS02]|uniref:Secreted peptide n=1 Tax=Leuconostoc aquikimchii TaxID=3236804 RepID=A0ABV3S3Y6_9LACO